MNILLKLDKNDSEERSETVSGSRRVQERSRGVAYLMFFCIFGATWAILGAILGPAGRQGAPKIELLGTKSSQKVEK